MILDIESRKKQKKCNLCGYVFDRFDTHQNATIHKLIGYGSKYDGQNLDLNLCCKCLDILIEKCKINPLK